MKTAEMLERLKNVKATGKDKWSAQCPAHEDRQNSLSVRYDYDSDKTLLHCFAGCHSQQIVEALGLKWCDLMGSTQFAAIPGSARQTCDLKPKADKPAAPPVSEKSSFATCSEAANSFLHKIKANSYQTYQYARADGSLFCNMIRFDYKEGHKVVRPFSCRDGRWVMADPEGLFPLFRLSAVLKNVEQPLFVVEGEKCVSALEGLAWGLSRQPAPTGPPQRIKPIGQPWRAVKYSLSPIMMLPGGNMPTGSTRFSPGKIQKRT